MKQRIRVVSLCKRGDQILILKRAGGRVEGATNFELPIGKIEFGEQPDEAMARVIYEYLGAQTEKMRLSDVVTFTALDGASELGNLYIIYDIILGDEKIELGGERYNQYKWVKRSDINNYELDEATRMVLQITAEKTIGVSAPVITVEASDRATVKDTAPSDNAVLIYTDGGSRGNPGPSGIGYCIFSADGREIKRGGDFLGFSTSRLAEYYGLKAGIEQAIEAGYKKVKFRSDSLMLVNQMNGIYPVKNRDLLQVYSDVWQLLGKLDSYSFMHVPREQNREADAEVNLAIDRYLQTDED